MRRTTAVFAALYVVFMMYSIELYIWGENGYLAMQDLSRYGERLETNVNALKKVQASLGREFEGLQKSPDKIELAARKLGYFAPEEHRVIVENMGIGNSYYLVGELVKPYSPSSIDVTILRIIAFLFGISAYFILRFSGGKSPEGGV